MVWNGVGLGYGCALICWSRATWAGGDRLAQGCPILEPSLTVRDAPGQAGDAPGRALPGISDAHRSRLALDLPVPIAAVL